MEKCQNCAIYEVHSALDRVMSVPEYEIPQALVLSNGNVKTSGKVNYMPVYMVMFIKNEPEGFADVGKERFMMR